jgi:alpha-beta hydrolase superfamily lysophospholipase
LDRMTIHMTDGHMVSAFLAEPEGPPKGHIHLLHGMAEHIGRYAEFAGALGKAGYIVSGHDHRGHGSTVRLNGTRGYFAEEDGFERVVQDVHEVTTLLRDSHPAPAFTIFGHSMGSFVARRYTQRYGHLVDRAIFMGSGDHPGPAIRAGRMIADGYIAAGLKKEPNQFLNSLTFGRYNLHFPDAETPFDWLNEDQEAVRAYLDDEDSGFVSTTGFFSDLFDGLDLIHDDREIRRTPDDLPILLISGGSDPVGKSGAGIWNVARQYAQNGVRNVTVYLVEEGRHEILHSPKKSRITEYITGWLES